MKKYAKIIFILSLILILSACNKSTLDAPVSPTSGNLRIARQYSIMYAPVYVIEKKELLKKYLPNMTVEWSEFGSGAVINEALAANRLDIAFVGTPVSFIAWDKGVEIKILSNVCVSPLGLQVNNPAIKSLADFTETDKIALPNIGSIQHIILSMACEKELGDAHALDNNLVSMTHPDGAMALINGGGVSAHFTALPYIAQENAAGFETIMTGIDAFGGDYSTIVAVAARKLYDTNPMALAGFLGALSEAMYLINQRDPDVINIIAETEKITIEEVQEFLDWSGTNYTTTLYGLDGMLDFMMTQGYISKKPEMDQILWESAYSTIGLRSGDAGILETAQKRIVE